jgi:hypothetical protein
MNTKIKKFDELGVGEALPKKRKYGIKRFVKGKDRVSIVIWMNSNLHSIPERSILISSQLISDDFKTVHYLTYEKL